MPIDRRGFMRVFAGGVAWLAGGPARAEAAAWTCEIHQQTRNTLLGPVGRKWWPARRSRRRTKAYVGHERLALPAPTAAGGRSLAGVISGFRVGEGFADAPLDLAGVSRLLHFGNGVTQPPRLRAAPSAGAQYAGEIYLVARDVTGLAQGVYYYTPPGHALVRLQSGPRMEAVCSGLEDPGRFERASAVLVLTNVFGRYGWRYANRGYRYALIDSGHIGENLRLVARSAGFAECAPLRFHDQRLNTLLGLDARREAVCAVHAFGHRGEAKASAGSRRFRETREAPPGWGDTARYHARTGLVDRGGEETVVDTAKPTAPGLTTALRPQASVEECIRKRRSAQVFRNRPMRRDQLDWILEAAIGHPSLVRVPGVELLLAVHRVAGLEPGLYRATPASASLSVLQQADLREPLVRHCLGQDKAGACGVAFFGVGDLRTVLGARGERGYRDLLIEAGAVGQRIYLAAEAVGLAARNLAAFRDDPLNRLLELDGRERAVLHLTLAGHEA